ncbi:MAG TPA: hypothetical protein VGK67_06715 [Myxococcales bacterium]
MLTAVVVLLGCAGPTKQQVLQSAVVPVPALAPLPAPTTHQLDVAAAYSLLTGQGRSAKGTNAEVYVPRHQADLAAQLRISPNAAVRFLYLHGFRAGARPSGDARLSAPDDGANAFGAGVVLLFHPAESLELGGWLDLALALAAARIVVCENGCGQVSTAESRQETALGAMTTVGLMLRLSVLQRLRLSAALAVRNQPTNEAAEVRSQTWALVSPGPLYMAVEANAEVTLWKGLSADLSFQAPCFTGPFGFSPVVSLGLRGRFDVLPPEPPLRLPEVPAPPAPADASRSAP